MIETETEIYLINFKNKLTEMPLQITWEIQEKVLFAGREGKCLQGICFEKLKRLYFESCLLQARRIA